MSRQMTREEAQRIGRIGGLRMAATRDPKTYTQKARATFIQGFFDRTPAELPTAERQRRAAAAHRAHMAQLALRSVKARQKR